MKDWILYSLKCRKGQAGFALPVAIGMGLIILLVGLTMLLRSQDSQVSAIAQKDTAKSLNAAETGVNEIRALINQHREIALRNGCDNRDTNGNCLDSGLTESWFLPGNIPNFVSECNVDINAKTTEISTLANQTWRPVNSSDLSQGEYRLLKYVSTGVLTVEGRVNADEPSESISKVEVNFPIQPVEDRIAGLWVASTADTTQVDANVEVVGPCSSVNPVQPSALVLPTIPQEPTSPTSNITTLSGASFPQELPRKNTNIPPQVIDSPDADGIYRYKVDTLNSDFKVEPGNKIELWVDGNLDLQGVKIRHICPNNSSCGPFDVKIFGKGNSGNTISINNATTIICNVLIHAPTYNVDAVGTPPTLPAVSDCRPKDPTLDALDVIRNTGVYWVNQWGNSESPLLNLSRAVWNDAPQNLFVYPPRLGPVQKWETQPVN